jgi:hypothetical protein
MKDVLIKSAFSRIAVLAICTLWTATSAQAQFISGVSKPGPETIKITDVNLPEVKYANMITADDLYEHLSTIASDEMEGRETGYPGNDMAKEYLVSQFAAIGLAQPEGGEGYLQKIAFTKSKWEENTMTVNGKEFKHLRDYMTFPTTNTDMDINTDDVMFLGYGIDDPAYSDYTGQNVSGKVIMIYNGEPMNADSVSFVTGTKELSPWSGELGMKLEVAKQKGVRMVLIVEEGLKEFLFKNRKYLVGAKLDLGDFTQPGPWANHTYISSTIAKEIIGKKTKKFMRLRKRITRKGKSKAADFQNSFQMTMKKDATLISGSNVMGLVIGSEKPNEIIVVSAHYDHIGRKGDEIFNGADDNGSGTSTVLELAESFAQAAREGNAPKRSILFMLVTGEEKGLLGSEYYAENPLYPLANTVADVNIDMVGRVDKKYTDNPNYIYVIGSDRLSMDLHDINEQVNNDYTQLTLDYKYNDEKDPNRYYFRSDHYNFASRGIPAIFFFNGTHEDYHQPGDTVDKINFEKMTQVGRHIFHLTWELANREDRIRLN